MKRDDWRQWMAALGERLRRARQFLKLSQAQVAEMAGVSQGAMSRLEHGKGLETPMSVVLKLHAVIAQSLREYDPALLDDELKWVLEFGSMLAENHVPTHEPKKRIGDADDLSELFRAVRALPEGRRVMVLGVVRALLETVEQDERRR
jgi:transcriptional regulator with XRE-family HTH domain